MVILGAGHNGLVAASYLTRAGLTVPLLEKNDYIGGATTSQKSFPISTPGSPVIPISSAFSRRRLFATSDSTSSSAVAPLPPYTPYFRDGHYSGLLLSNISEEIGLSLRRRANWQRD